MKALLICDDYWHPGDIVEKGFEFLPEYGFELTVVKRPHEIWAQKLSDYDLVILSKSENTRSEENNVLWMTEDAENEIVDYVENGGGFLVTHSGTVPYKTAPKFTALLGCAFTHHPEACPVTMTPLKKYPLNEGVETFTETDEHYHVVVSAEDADIFMATVSAHGAQTGGYVRRQGSGRVCVLTPGHRAEVWANANYRQMLKNAVDYCTGK